MENLLPDSKELDIKSIRKKMGMSQQKFAETFGISAGTIRNWEQKHRRPAGSVRTLLLVIDREPEAVKRALQENENVENVCKQKT